MLSLGGYQDDQSQNTSSTLQRECCKKWREFAHLDYNEKTGMAPANYKQRMSAAGRGAKNGFILGYITTIALFIFGSIAEKYGASVNKAFVVKIAYSFIGASLVVGGLVGAVHPTNRKPGWIPDRAKRQ